MKTKYLIITLMALALIAFAGCEGNKPTTKLTAKKAKESFNAFVPTAIVNSVSPSPIDGVFEVVVENEGKKGIIYMAADGKYILTGAMLNSVDGENMTTERMYELTKVDISQIALANSITLGAKDGPYKIVVFTDPLCSACAAYHQELIKATAINKQLTVYIKVFPLLDKSPESYDKVRSITCAKDNMAALRRLEFVFEGKDIPAPDCDGVIAGDNLAMALQLNIARTPTTIFKTGVKIMEAMRADSLLKEVEKRSGVKIEN